MSRYHNHLSIRTKPKNGYSDCLSRDIKLRLILLTDLSNVIEFCIQTSKFNLRLGLPPSTNTLFLQKPSAIRSPLPSTLRRSLRLLRNKWFNKDSVPMNLLGFQVLNGLQHRLDIKIVSLSQPFHFLFSFQKI